MQRIIFNGKKDRNKFFSFVLTKSSLKSWKEFYAKLSVPKASFERYRNGILSLPENLFQKLSEDFSRGEIIYFNNRIKTVQNNWGQVKGGRITYSKHNKIFEIGRKKGLEKMIKNTLKFDINIPLNNILSYFIGLFIGEGFTNKYGGYYLTQFTGHKSEEDFYRELIVPYVKKTFNIEPKIKSYSGDNFIRVNLYSKCLFDMITNRFKIKAGRKSYIVLIPEEIISSSRDNLLYCISGIFDAEACFFVDKREIYSKPYPRIDLHMVNPHLIKQISEILNEHNVKHSIIGDYSRINLYGNDNVLEFLEKVGFSNPKHISKVENFFGKDVKLKRLI